MDIFRLAEKGPFMPQKHTRAYPADFRHKVVELARAGRGADELADEFKLARQTVRNWIKQADLDSGRRSDGPALIKKKTLDYANAFDSWKLSAISSQRPRRGLLARPSRFRQSLRIRESAPCPLARCYAMSRAGCLDQRLFRVAQA